VSTDDPPLLIFHGDMDKTVLLDQSQAIESAYKKAGLWVELNVLKGSGHGGTEFFTDANGKRLYDFLQAKLKVTEATTSP
jgi:dipeptidyl aminopeptidase/acylaminoacyl peptidase